MESRTFEARYPGACTNCEQNIAPGQLCRYEDNTVVHTICPTETVHRRPTCPNCWLETAANGTCGCDD